MPFHEIPCEVPIDGTRYIRHRAVELLVALAMQEAAAASAEASPIGEPRGVRRVGLDL